MIDYSLDQFANYMSIVRESEHTEQTKSCARLTKAHVKDNYKGKFYISQDDIQIPKLKQAYKKKPLIPCIYISYDLVSLPSRYNYFYNAICSWYGGDGRLHRLGGPAKIDYARNTRTWYYFGQKAIRMPHSCKENETFILKEKVYIILRHLEGEFYEALCGDTKRIVVDTTHYKYFEGRIPKIPDHSLPVLSKIKRIVNFIERW